MKDFIIPIGDLKKSFTIFGASAYKIVESFKLLGGVSTQVKGIYKHLPRKKKKAVKKLLLSE